MATTNALSGFVASVLRVTGSVILGKHSAVLYSGEGAVGALAGLDDLDAETPGEQAADVEGYGGFGLVFRPRPPEKLPGGEELAAEAMALRTPGGLVPLAWRDLRIHRRFSAPKPGTVALVGYGGGFLSLDDAAGGESTLTTLYVPYSRNEQGVPEKAMLISIDPVSESLMLVHGEGYAVVLDKDNGIMMRADENTYLNLKPDRFYVQAKECILQGNVALGANTMAAVSLLPGLATQPTPSVFFSPV